MRVHKRSRKWLDGTFLVLSGFFCGLYVQLTLFEPAAAPKSSVETVRLLDGADFLPPLETSPPLKVKEAKFYCNDGSGRHTDVTSIVNGQVDVRKHELYLNGMSPSGFSSIFPEDPCFNVQKKLSIEYESHEKTRVVTAIEGEDVARAQAESSQHLSTDSANLVVLICPSKLSSIHRREGVRKWFRRFTQPVQGELNGDSEETTMYQMKTAPKGGESQRKRWIFQLLFVLGDNSFLEGTAGLGIGQCGQGAQPFGSEERDTVLKENRTEHDLLMSDCLDTDKNSGDQWKQGTDCHGESSTTCKVPIHCVRDAWCDTLCQKNACF